MRGPKHDDASLDHDADHYAVLAVAPLCTTSEIRRAYRRLALRHHPDRAGPDSTARFQRIALAYRVLSNPVARSAYDARRAPTALGPAVGLLQRFAAPLETLIARAVARRLEGGIVELLLNGAEAHTGGTAALGVTVRVACPTCGGCAQPGSLWCMRCEFAGTVSEEVTACIDIPPSVPDGATFSVRLDPLDATPPLRVRVRL